MLGILNPGSESKVKMTIVNHHSMRRLITICLLLATAFSATAQNCEEIFSQAYAKYDAGQYAAAAADYESILAQGYTSAHLYNNLGNCYYRQGEIGLARLNYERAHILDPRDVTILQNINFVNSKSDDHIESMPKNLLVRVMNTVINIFSAHVWVYILIIVMMLTCVAMAFFLLSHSYSRRKAGMIISVILWVMLIFTLIPILCSVHIYYSRNKAVVTVPMTMLKDSPDKGSPDKMILHEGTNVTFHDDVENWRKVSLDDGTTGWIVVEDVTVI